MIKTVLIEDEKLVLNGMTSFLKKIPEVDLLGTADNGLDGLKLILETKPDLVFTDIRMPGLNGLEMIEQAQKQNPNIVYVIFSGFNEFKYVQQAIGLGVLDYLEKPVTVQTLKKTLERANSLVEYKKNYQKLKTQNAQVEKVMIEKILNNLINQPKNMEDYNVRELINVAEDLSFATEIAVLCVNTIDEKTSTVDQESYRKLIGEMTSEMTKEHQIEVYVLSIKERLYFIYFNFECEIFPFEKQAQLIRKHLEEEGIEIYAGLSTISQNIHELRRLIVEAGNAYMYAAYLEKEDVVTLESVEYVNHIEREISGDSMPFMMNFRLKDFEACRKQISDYLNHIRSQEIMPVLLKHECIAMIELMYQLAEEMGIKGNISKSEFAFLNQAVSARSIIEWAMKNADMIMDEISKEPMKDQRPARRIREYLEEHYAESITLESLAEYVQLNPTYLSMMFKKEEGISYSKCLLNIRIQHARELLEAGEKAKDVCEKVGYYDYRYFSRQFKKIVGTTPDVYKKQVMPKK